MGFFKGLILECSGLAVRGFPSIMPWNVVTQRGNVIRRGVAGCDGTTEPRALPRTSLIR